MPRLSPFAPILVVDADEQRRAASCAALAHAGYAVYQARTGAAAVSLLRASARPMVVVLSLGLLDVLVADQSLSRHVYVVVSPLLPSTARWLGARFPQFGVLALSTPYTPDALVGIVADSAASFFVAAE